MNPDEKKDSMTNFYLGLIIDFLAAVGIFSFILVVCFWVGYKL